MLETTSVQMLIELSPKAGRRALNEKKIKCLVLDAILKKSRARIVGAEVPFLSGRRWADLLLITENGDLIAFEIKSDQDSLRRMSKQISDYARTFNEVHLILSSKFKNSPLVRALPGSIGLAFVDRLTQKIDYIRKPAHRKNLSKTNLLYFLWKKELTAYQRDERESVQDVRRRMGRTRSLREIKKQAVAALVRRYGRRYKTFLREKSSRVQVEDLAFLTKTSWDTF